MPSDLPCDTTTHGEPRALERSSFLYGVAAHPRRFISAIKGLAAHEGRRYAETRNASARGWGSVLSGAMILFSTGVAAFAQPASSRASAPPQEPPVTPDATPKPANRLIRATSPYLLQHAHNPVDWYEWSAEAFEKARKEDRPIFLSIGYAACHWCHVMEHESFESNDVAAALNVTFVSIKVDREERPDIDELYMAYTQALTGHGGWPMSVFLTPDGTPFHAGTYFPKEQFLDLLHHVAETWRKDRTRLTGGADAAKQFFSKWAEGPSPADGVIPRDQVDQTAKTLARHFDPTQGGLASGNNKFPPSMAMELLLRTYRRNGDNDLWHAVENTLDHMARGGIYDHVGGGICRYSTDPEWLVPHFEKMLYDQALVSSIYLDAFQASRHARFAATARDILDYVLTDLRAAEGAFYSSRDADSEGLEGKFYLWTVEQVVSALGEEDGRLFCKFHDVTETGNWFERFGHAPPGPKNILHVSKPIDVFAKVQGLDAAELDQKLAGWRKKLSEVRAKRVPPALDDKVLTDWNGLMIASLAKGSRVLDDPKYAEAAAKAAEFILSTLRRDGRLLRSYRQGEARGIGNLADYAFMTEGLLNLYEAAFDRRWLDEAVRLTDICIKYHYDSQGGAFFFIASDAEALIARSKHPHDSAIPSGNSMMAMNLLRLATLLDRQDYREKAEATLRALAPLANQSPASFERLLCAADFYHDKVKEIAIVGSPQADETKALLRAVHDRYLPNKVVVHAAEKLAQTDIPLLRGKGLIGGKPTAYVCEGYRCQNPVTSPEALAKQLDGEVKTTAGNRE